MKLIITKPRTYDHEATLQNDGVLIVSVPENVTIEDLPGIEEFLDAVYVEIRKQAQGQPFQKVIGEQA